MLPATKGFLAGFALIVSAGLVLSGCDGTPTGVKDTTSPELAETAHSSTQYAAQCESVRGTIEFLRGPDSETASGTLEGDLTGEVTVTRKGLKKFTRGVAIGLDKFVFETGADDFGTFEGTSDNTVVTFSQIGAQQTNAHVEITSGAKGNLTLNGRASFNPVTKESTFTGEYHGRVCNSD